VESFDPYRKWLGIPQQDQPPHHYRLLGIELFESDPDVIANAADGRMAQIKTFQTGKSSELSQRILNEVAAAKVCLLNPQKKVEYDRRLQARLKSAPAQDAVAADDKNAGAPDSELFFGQIAPVSSFTSRKSKRSAKRGWGVPATIAAALVLLSGSFAVMVVLNHPQTVGENAAAKAGPRNTVSATLPADPLRGCPGSADSGKAAVPQPPKPATGAEIAPSLLKSLEPRAKSTHSADKEAATSEPGSLRSAPPQLKEFEKPAPHPRPPAPAPVAKNPPALDARPKKAAAPSDAQQAEIEAKIRQIYKKEFSDAKSGDSRTALAAKFLQQGTAAGDDPLTRFVLWRLGSHLAAKAGALDRAFEAADKMGEQYDVDRVELKADLLADMVDTLRPGSPAAQQTAILGEKLAEAAVAADNFDLANRLVKLASTAAHKTNDVQLKRQILLSSGEVSRLKQAFSPVQKARKVLDDKPDDADANLIVGRWYCFAKGKWEKGLPMLAKGSDSSLAALAKQDLAAPVKPSAQMELADAWWNLAGKPPASAKSALQARAAFWYEGCLPGLSGLDKIKAQKRLDSLSGDAKSPPAKAGGVVVPGNVALATNGTKVEGAARCEMLIDGDVSDQPDNYAATISGGRAFECTVTFKELYRLRQIRILFYQHNTNRSSNYGVSVSADGQQFVPLVDRSMGEWRGWQVLDFPPRPVKAMKLYGVPGKNGLMVVEIEAYCISPANHPLPR
jgi:hypothetical protein